jgi:hypothetical protein
MGQRKADRLPRCVSPWLTMMTVAASRAFAKGEEVAAPAQAKAAVASGGPAKSYLCSLEALTKPRDSSVALHSAALIQQ